MRTLTLLLFSGIPLLAQSVSSTTANHIRYGATTPATCSPATGDVYFKNTATVTVYYCDATNHWTALSGGGGGGSPSGVNQFQWDSAGSFAGAPNLLRRSATAIGVGADSASASATTATLSVLDFTTAAINEGVYLELDKAARTQSLLIGIDAELYTSAASNITTVKGAQIIISNNGASHMGSATGLAVSLENVGGSTITDEFAINVIGDSHTGVTNKHGLYIGTQSGASGVNSAIETELGIVTFGDVMTSANVKRGAGTPEGAVVGVVGDIYQRTDGGTGTSLYRKESGSSNTGWVAVASGGGSPGGADLTLQYRIDGSTFGGMSGTSWNDSTRSFGAVDGSSNPIFSWSADPTNSCPFCFNASQIAPAPVSMGNGTTASNSVQLLGYSGGSTTDAAGNGGDGGPVNFIAGSGGSGGATGGNGGTTSLAAGSGGQSSSANGTGGDGQDILLSAGQGGAAIGVTSTGGRAGNISLTPGIGGAGTSANGPNGKVLVNSGFATELGTCTAATLSSILTAAGDMCFCTDCKVTTVSVNVVSDATCTGTGAGSLAINIGGTAKCQHLP